MPKSSRRLRPEDFTEADATFSADGLRRYTLDRGWEGGDGSACWIGMNPSKAGARPEENDPTVWRFVDFTRRWGLSRFTVRNLFTLISPEPKDIKKSAIDPVGGAVADELILEGVTDKTVVIVCWGQDIPYSRDRQVLRLLASHAGPLFCLGINKDGTPKHPLYIRGTCEPVEFVNPHKGAAGAPVIFPRRLEVGL